MILIQMTIVNQPMKDYLYEIKDLDTTDNVQSSGSMRMIINFSFFTDFNPHHPFISKSVVYAPPCFWVGVEHMFDDTPTFSWDKVV
jgi:hypothetical protein